ncbi:hypothetical protein Fcan01_20773 [Folsomia candida]|uniref:Uncharacterized protein n=1 Tax=Folsomia candida TaxID=158441 RepID=A0A226DHP6_FOLCA|nr:hypothetical protein Fcan01_20773 [Folsomia candida]
MVRNIPKTFSDLVCSVEDVRLFRSEGFKKSGEKVSSRLKEVLSYLENFYQKSSNMSFPEKSSCFRLLSPASLGRHEGRIIYSFEDYLYMWYAEFREMEILSALRISNVRLLLDFFNPSHALRPRLAGRPGLQDVQYAAEKEIVSCAKTAYIGDPSLIDAEIEYLRKRYFWIDFHKGRDILSGHIIGWMVEKEGRLQTVSRSYWAMLESGIYRRLLVEITARKIIKEKRFVGKVTVKEKLESVGMNGGIVTLFILILCLNLVAFGFFLFEFHTLVWRKIVIVILKIVSAAVKLSIFCRSCLNKAVDSFRLYVQALVQVVKRIKIPKRLKFG